MQAKNRPWGALLLLATALIASCASTAEAPTQAQISEEVTVEATVLAVDKTSRELTLQRPDGIRVVVVAGPEVRNFDQISAGDTLNASYTVSLSARRLGPDEPDTQPVVGLTAARAEQGEKPAGAIGAGVAMTVVVKSVDLAQNVVVFTNPDGAIQAIEAQRDEGKRFITGLKPGDRVELVYGEAMVLSVD